MPLTSRRIPVVSGLAYVERVRRLPPSFTATLVREPDNRYFRHAIAVIAHGEKVGYVAPEVAMDYADAVASRQGAAAVTCPARRAAPSDRESSGVELLLDFTDVELGPAA